MKLEQLYSESSSERLAFGMDGSGCGRQNPRVSEKLVPVMNCRKNLTKEKYFTVFVLQPYWISGQEAKLLRRLRERAGQQESIMINEYISTSWPAGSLRNGTHLSFTGLYRSKRFWVSLHHVRTPRPLVGYVRCSSNCLYFGSELLLSSRFHNSTGLQKLTRLQLSSARSMPYFPFPFSLVQAVLQALSAGVGRLHLQEVV
ncbi:Hypothetical_protein [Hexamita inflata]|uniref:Hypothetical_protein n=1 Tax=Hexamita inflata TaxID=28002 RepID=A0AA86PHP7_9EUKA|nr:Hypothetical protein HINF_LOCUS26127 [Hexamita inflata]